MNWLITGGCGFIGRNLVKLLIQQDQRIRILDNFSTGKPEDLLYATDVYDLVESIDRLNWGKNLQIIKSDILDFNPLLEIFEGADIIVHLAANTGVGPSVENPRMDCMTNILGTFNCLEATKTNNIKRFVFASSGAPIGECIPPIHEEMACHPVSPYGASKLAGEAYCSAYYRTFGVETVALRFGNVYGPGSTHKSSVVAKFIRQAINREILEIYGSGNQTRDFLFTEDLVNAIWLAGTTENVGGEIFQISSNKETTVLEITNHLVVCLKELGVIGINIVHGDKRLGDVLRNFSDTSKAAKMLNWVSKETLESGLKKTTKWFLDRK